MLYMKQRLRKYDIESAVTFGKSRSRSHVREKWHKIGFFALFKLILPQFRLTFLSLLNIYAYHHKDFQLRYFCPPGDFKIKVKVTKSLIFRG